MSCPENYHYVESFPGVGSGASVDVCRHDIAVKPIPAHVVNPATGKYPSLSNLNECYIYTEVDQFCNRGNRIKGLSCADENTTDCNTPGRLSVNVVPGIDGMTWIHRQRGHFPDRFTWGRIAANLIQVMVGVWRGGLAHRDIKPANMIMDEFNYSVTLIDLGVACPFDSPTLCLGSSFGDATYLPTSIINYRRLDRNHYRDARQRQTYAYLARRYGSIEQGLVNVDAYMALVTIYCFITAAHVARPLISKTGSYHPRIIDPPHAVDCPPHIMQVLRSAIQEETDDFLGALLFLHQHLRPHHQLRLPEFSASRRVEVLSTARHASADHQARVIPRNLHPVCEQMIASISSEMDHIDTMMNDARNDPYYVWIMLRRIWRRVEIFIHRLSQSTNITDYETVLPDLDEPRMSHYDTDPVDRLDPTRTPVKLAWQYVGDLHSLIERRLHDIKHMGVCSARAASPHGGGVRRRQTPRKGMHNSSYIS